MESRFVEVESRSPRLVRPLNRLGEREPMIRALSAGAQMQRSARCSDSILDVLADEDRDSARGSPVLDGSNSRRD